MLPINPKRDIKSRELENYVASRVGKTLVRKFLGNKAKGLGGLLQSGGGTQQPTTQQQPSSNEPPAQPVQQQPQQPLKAEDAVKGLLKGLFKN